MTTALALTFHGPYLANALPAFVGGIHVHARAIANPRRVSNVRVSAEAHLAETRRDHEAMRDTRTHAPAGRIGNE